MEANGETEQGRPPRDTELKKMGGPIPGGKGGGTLPSPPPSRSSDPRLQLLTLPSLSPLPPAPPGPRPFLLLCATQIPGQAGGVTSH